MDTTILLKRALTLAQAANVQLKFGEPVYTNDEYITVGNEDEDYTQSRNVLRLVPKEEVDNTVFFSKIGNKNSLHTYDGTSAAEIITFGNCASKDLSNSIQIGNNNPISADAVAVMKENIENSISTLSNQVSAFADKDLDTTVNPNSTNPVTSKAVYEFVTQLINTKFSEYRPWTTDATDRTRFYLNTSEGLQYYTGTRWEVVPVGYTL